MTDRVEFFGHRVADYDLASLREMDQIKELEIRICRHITDAGLQHLAGLTGLQHLEVSRSNITDAGLPHLAGLTNLQYLDLHHTEVTDAGLQYLAGLTNLQDLDLEDTDITDACLEYLTGLTNLRSLQIRRTGVSYAGFKKLQQALPDCKISADHR